jgi:hypothetical protein
LGEWNEADEEEADGVLRLKKTGSGLNEEVTGEKMSTCLSDFKVRRCTVVTTTLPGAGSCTGKDGEKEAMSLVDATSYLGSSASGLVDMNHVGTVRRL